MYRRLPYKMGGVISDIRNNRILKKKYSIANDFLKEHYYSDISANEKKEIDDYWQQYCIKFPDYSWFRMYYGITGIHSPYFIPNDIVHQILIPHYNNISCISGWDDKNVYELLLDNIHFPLSLAHCVNGRLYDKRWNNYRRDEDSMSKLATTILQELDIEVDRHIILKEARESFAGKGVRLLNVSSVADMKNILGREISKNYIIQKRIVQHPFFSQFCQTSVNIIRIITWRNDDDVLVLSSSIRFGTDGSFTDVAYKDGKEIVNVVGVSSDGLVSDRFVNFDGNALPIQIQDRQVPCWDEIVSVVKAAAKRLLHFDLVGWDFTVNDKNEVICIEYNIHWPGTILYQYANGPLAGKHTDQLLSFLKDKAEQKNIPKLFKK